MKSNLLYIILICMVTSVVAQNDSIIKPSEDIKVVIEDTIKTALKEPYDPLAPSRAAFYSAVLPGLGQAYNKKYWKIPVVYGGMAAGVYFYIRNDIEYDRFRDAYKRRLAGFSDDEFFGEGTTPVISDQRLIDAQRSSQRNKDYSVIAVLAFYLLNIVDANVDAHLRQYEVDEDLTIVPQFDVNQLNNLPNYGLSLRYIIK